MQVYGLGKGGGKKDYKEGETSMVVSQDAYLSLEEQPCRAEVERPSPSFRSVLSGSLLVWKMEGVEQRAGWLLLLSMEEEGELLWSPMGTVGCKRGNAGEEATHSGLLVTKDRNDKAKSLQFIMQEYN